MALVFVGTDAIYLEAGLRFLKVSFALVILV